MSKQTFTVSDLSGKPIIKDDDVVSIVVHDHPHLEHAVTIDADKAELAGLAKSKKDFVVIELLTDGGDQRERMVLELAQFEQLFMVDATEALKEAEHYDYGGLAPQEKPKPRGRKPAATADDKPAKVDYRTIENAGRVHRGRITDDEKLQVQQNFDKVNKNLKATGERVLELTNAEHVEKYGLLKLAQDRGVIPK